VIDVAPFVAYSRWGAAGPLEATAGPAVAPITTNNPHASVTVRRRTVLTSGDRTAPPPPIVNGL
jgi:hypothetical protein